MSRDAFLIPIADVASDMVETLLDRAFGPDRAARTAYAIREGTQALPALSFAALDREELLVGTIQCWPVSLTDDAGRAHPLIMIGPVAVVPERQSEGFGKALMLASLGALGADPLPQVMIGDPDYYSRFFGFSAAHTGGWRCPGEWQPDRLLARATNPAVLPESGMLGPWRG